MAKHGTALRLLLSQTILYIAFWWLFFQGCRLAFIGYHYARFANYSVVELAKTFFYGWRMDISAACYATAIPLIGWFLGALFPVVRRGFLLRAYTYTMVVIVSALCIIDANLYQEWGVKVNADALQIALKSPSEAAASASSAPYIVILPFFAALLVFGIGIFKVYFRRLQSLSLGQSTWVAALLYLLVSVPLVVVGFRGGLQLAPLNPSHAYHSSQLLLNHATVNTVWNFIFSIANGFKPKNPYHFMPSERLTSVLGQLDATPPSILPDTARLLTSNAQRPNVVLILLESFTADVMATLGGIEGVAPHLDSIAQKGLLFTKCYASGDRTYKAMPAVFSAFPSLPTEKILKYQNKIERFPCLARQFSEQGYATSFYYGGEMEFGNIKSYMLACGFDKLVDYHQFSATDRNAKWGVHDHILLDRLIDDLKQTPQPFFASLLTLSNHEPFDIPTPPHFAYTPNEPLVEAIQFKNTAYYTSQSIAAFFAKARQQSWYDNTLFILVADHGHRLPKNRQENYISERYHIPMIWYGEPLKPQWRGAKFDKITSQTDIAAILSAQLNMSSADYQWSKNTLLPEQQGYAFYAYEDGLGWVNPNGSVVFDNLAQTVIYNTLPADSTASVLQSGQAYLQGVYNDFLR